jgi:hypothetical protein
MSQPPEPIEQQTSDIKTAKSLELIRVSAVCKHLNHFVWSLPRHNNLYTGETTYIGHYLPRI